MKKFLGFTLLFLSSQVFAVSVPAKYGLLEKMMVSLLTNIEMKKSML